MGFKARFMLFSWRVEYGVCESEDSWPPFPSANVNKDNIPPNREESCTVLCKHLTLKYCPENHNRIWGWEHLLN